MPDGSSIKPYEPLHVVVHPRPWLSASYTRIDYGMPPTLAEIVLDADIDERYAPLLHVYIDDDEIPRHLWPRVRPKFGHLVRVLVAPGKKNPLAMILMLVVAVVAAVVAPYLAPIIGATVGLAAGSIGVSIIGSVIAAGINLIGALVIGALVPPPDQPSTYGGGAISTGLGSLGGVTGIAPTGDTAVSAPTFQITGTSNRFNPWGPIPRVFGKRRMFPTVAARAFTETQGSDQYLRLLLVCGYGPLRISDIRIGETPLSFYSGVDIEVKEGWPTDTPVTLYTRTIREDQLQIRLLEGAAYVSRTSHVEAVELNLDLTFARGLAKYENDGKLTAISAVMTVQYKLNGTTTWSTPTFIDPDGSGFTTGGGAGTVTVNRASRESFRIGVRWAVTSGTYDVRVINSTAAPATSLIVQDVYWTALRTVQAENPLRQSGLSVIAMRIKASNQLNGTPDQINCIAESYLPVWSGTAWSWAVSRNPAWAYADVLRRRGTEVMLADSRIDLDGILAWANACAANAPDRAEPYWCFDAVVEGGSVFSVLRTIAATGRASFTMKDGKYSVIRDVAQTVPVQHITPRNSWAYNGAKAFLDLPHALKVRFVNEDLGFQEDERIVYDDGQSEATASKFETLDLPSVTRSSQAWREGRYFFAQGKLRPEEHKVTMDIENLRATMGDLVQFSHFAISIGLGSGRISAYILDSLTNTYLVGFLLDGDVQFDVAHSYAIRIRIADGTSLLYLLTNPATVTTGSITTRTVTLYTQVLPSASTPKEGDLYQFGRSTLESAPMIIRRIEPGPNLTAVLSMCDAQPGVWTADSGPIPPFNSYITHQAQPQYRQPPEIPFSLRSDETALLVNRDGSLRERIAVDIGSIQFNDVAIGGFEAQYTPAGLNDWKAVPRVNFDVRTIYCEPVTTGSAYDVRLRAISQYSVAGNWRMITGHVVIGKTTPPPAPTRVLVEGNLLVVDYPNAPLDFLGFKVEYHRGISPSRDGAESAHPSSTTVDMPFDISALPSGLLTIFVTAMDTSGNLSDSRPVYIVIEAADIANIVDTVDYHALGWPGSITNGTIDVIGGTGDLGNQGDPTDLFLPVRADRFLAKPDDPFLLATFLEMTWEFTVTPDDIDVPSQMTITHTVEPGAWRLEYTGDDSEMFAALDDATFATPDADPFAPGGTTYGPFPSWITAKRVPYHFRVVLPGGHTEGRISEFILNLDVPDQEEEMENVVVPAAGLRLAVTKAYREIRHISYILQDDGHNAVKVQKLDYAVWGPLVQPFNTAGAAVQALVDFRIKGVAQT